MNSAATAMEEDIEASISCMTNLESVWIPAKRCRVMLEELFKVSTRLKNQKRPYSEPEPSGVV